MRTASRPAQTGSAASTRPAPAIWNRANIAAYGDAEVDVAASVRLGAAVRFEDFDGFGSVTNYKLAGRWQLSSNFAVRGSAGTGFRAPTPGQQNANNLSTVVDSATGVFREQGTVASTNPVALALGGRALDAERSKNYTLGLVVELDSGTDLTIDWFRIDLEDRIALSDNISVDDALRAQLTAAGVAAASDFNRIRYFTNDYDTETTGVDVVLTKRFDWTLGATDVLFGYNRTRTHVEDFGEASTASRTRAIERARPHRASASCRTPPRQLELAGPLQLLRQLVRLRRQPCSRWLRLSRSSGALRCRRWPVADAWQRQRDPSVSERSGAFAKLRATLSALLASRLQTAVSSMLVCSIDSAVSDRSAGTIPAAIDYHDGGSGPVNMPLRPLRQRWGSVVA